MEKESWPDAGRVDGFFFMDDSQGCRLARSHRNDRSCRLPCFVHHIKKGSQPVKPKTTAKTSGTKTEVVDHRIWCERCSIRLAQNEERRVLRGKSYHLSCFEKLKIAPQGANSE